MAQAKETTESEFYAWRALFALAHVDGVVSPGEVRMMAEVLEDIPFSAPQKNTLKDDIKNPKDIVEMFERISDATDQARFFKFAHDMVWADGDYGKAEQAVLLRLKSIHVRNTNVDDLVGKVNLSFDDDTPADKVRKKPVDKRSMIISFRDEFMKARFR